MIIKLIKKQKGAHENTSAQKKSYPAFVCDILIKNYLTKEQEAYIRPLLRILKKSYQEELGTALMTYIKTGIVHIPEDIMLGAMFMQLTRVGLKEYDNTKDKRIIRPIKFQ